MQKTTIFAYLEKSTSNLEPPYTLDIKPYASPLPSGQARPSESVQFAGQPSMPAQRLRHAQHACFPGLITLSLTETEGDRPR